MIRSSLFLTIASAVWFCQPKPAHAGMPSVTLNEITSLRLQNISFFLAGFLLSALLLTLLWNWLRTDWKFLPRLTYPKALGVVFLWGLLFLLVLTMISGARELMTPGAWTKNGLTYKLTNPPNSSDGPSSGNDLLVKKREQQLGQLRTFLWNYAITHDGKFPTELAIPEIPKEVQTVPDFPGTTYLYVKGRKAGQGAVPLVYEPELFGPRRFVLLVNGEIHLMDSSELEQSLTKVQP